MYTTSEVLYNAFINFLTDEEDDKESGIHVSDTEEMEVGADPITPGDGLVAKGLSGMASCGRRGRTFSTGEEYVFIVAVYDLW